VLNKLYKFIYNYFRGHKPPEVLKVKPLSKINGNNKKI